MKLKNINRVMRLFGFVLVVATDDNDVFTQVWIERKTTYDKRCRGVKT